MVNIDKNIPWFRTVSQCRYSGLTVSHPDTFVSSHPASNYFVDVAKLGDRILLVRASGYVRSHEMTDALNFMDEYVSKYFDLKTGVFLIEDYRDVEGADFEARKKYINHHKDSDVFRGGILYNLPVLFRISFKIAKRLHIHGKYLYAVNSFEEAIALAQKLIHVCDSEIAVASDKKSDFLVSDEKSSGSILRRMSEGVRKIKNKLALWLNKDSTGHCAKVLLEYIESIDWHKDGITDPASHVFTDPNVRKVAEAISYIKSEIDDLLKEKEAAEMVLLEREARLVSYQSKLKQLSIQLSKSEEIQRRRLASQLHESVSQELFAAQLKLNTLEKSLDHPEHSSQLDGVKAQIIKSIRDIRDITYDLSPPVLYDLGLKEAVESLSKSIASKYRLAVKARFNGSLEHIDEEIKIILYRIIKEILHNAIKHARAGFINIIIDNTNNHLNVDVSDNGVGFDTGSLSEGQYTDDGFGLFDIREKINHLGGHLTIHSTPGSGTRVGVRVPLKEPFKSSPALPQKQSA